MPKLTTSAPNFGAFELVLGLTPSAPWFLGFKSWTEYYHQFFLVLQLADGRSHTLSVSTNTWVSSCHKSPYVHVYLVLFLRRTLTSIWEIQNNSFCVWKVMSWEEKSAFFFWPSRSWGRRTSANYWAEPSYRQKRPRKEQTRGSLSCQQTITGKQPQDRKGTKEIWALMADWMGEF